MLLFYCAEKADLPTIRHEGIQGTAGKPLQLWTSLVAARRACTSMILVIEAAALADLDIDEGYAATESLAWPSDIPPAAISNLDPYLKPKRVKAAGGYVVRSGLEEPEVLLIFRRGVWDLPKGKRDAGEAIEACALREVREEVGVQDLHLGPAVGTTVHGYERGGRYHIKTTYWFVMYTSETHFTPQAIEGIEAVAWVPWTDATGRLGYDPLRRHMNQIEERMHEAMERRQESEDKR